MPFTLTGRNAVVTGSSRGLGARFALDLGKAGANVLLNYTSPSSGSKVEAVMKEIRQANPSALVGVVKADMADANVGQMFLKAAVDLFADGDASRLKIHILINNAAIGESGFFESQTFDGIDRLYHVNVRGPFLISQALRPHIPSHDNARIIFISSIAARTGTPGSSIYSATKAAIESFVRTWNNEFGAEQGITVNAVNPGPVNTDAWNAVPEDAQARILKTMARAETSDISDIVLFLASKESRWISGSVVSANRGYLTF